MPDSGKPYSALIIGASGGIGSALAQSLRADPDCAQVKTLSRSQDGLDLANENAVCSAAAKLSKERVSFDLIVNASGALEIDGAPPEKAFHDLKAESLMGAFQINAVGAAMALKYFAPLLIKGGKAAFATLSARIGSIGDNRLGGWMSYRASKAALNQLVRCAAIEQKRRNKNSVIVALHPGTIKTPLTEKYAKGRYTATPDECAQNLLAVINRLDAGHSGGFFDYAGKEIEW